MDGSRGKSNAAAGALHFIEDGMTVGLGSGSTAEIFIGMLAERARRERLRVKCVPTSVRTGDIARKAGLEVEGYDRAGGIDIAVDGADQVDSKLNLIKGYGGALLREKIVDLSAKRFVVVVDESKLVRGLGGRVPLETVRFAKAHVVAELDSRGIASSTRQSGKVEFVTDNGNSIVDAEMPKIRSPARTDRELRGIVGVVETGIFADCVWRVVVGGENGWRELK